MASWILRFSVCSCDRKAFFASCCVMVLPPWAMPPLVMFVTMARPMPMGSIPIWS